MRALMRRDQAGFTFPELLISVLIVTILLGIASINLVQPQVTASLDTTVTTLLADLKSQQLLAMVGDSGSGGSQQPQGLYLQSTSYTLFNGSSYSSGATDNFVVSLGQNITLTTTFPSTQLVFAKATGDINSYSASTNTITLTSAGSTRMLTISRFGAVVVN